MRPLATVERFLERALERPAARLFRARLQPVQVLRRVERAMEADRVVEDGRATVPEQITVRVHPRDLATLGKSDELAAYLADGALSFARAHAYRLADRPEVRIQADHRAVPGDPEVRATRSVHGHGMYAETTGPGERPGADEGTRTFTAPVVRAPHAILEIRPLGRAPRTVELGTKPMTIGRSADNAIVLDDAAVSRHHARIQARGGALVLTDLGSTNGTRVNGSSVREVVLGDGDDVAIGDTVLSVHAADGPSDPDLPGRAST